MQTLWLLETKARNIYTCSACGELIQRGVSYFRHDPHPFARWKRGQTASYYCSSCIKASNPASTDKITNRLRIPKDDIHSNFSSRRFTSTSEDTVEDGLFVPPRVELIPVGWLLARKLRGDPSLIYRLTSDEFEEFICDRLYAMGFEPKQVGRTNQQDGGIDIVFWPRSREAFPILGAAQVKHHRNPANKEGPRTVREFQGAMARHPFNAGFIVTNTSFTPTAEWYARERTSLIRLRGMSDMHRWINDNFYDDAEWREIPETLELCPGIFVKRG